MRPKRWYADDSSTQGSITLVAFCATDHTHVLESLLLLEQATYGYTSTEIQARYAHCTLADTDDSSSAMACVFTVQHLSVLQRYSLSSETGGIQVCGSTVNGPLMRAPV